MKTSRSPFWQIPHYSMLFCFLIVFANGTLGQDTSFKPTKEPVSSSSPITVDSISNVLRNVTLPPAEFPKTKMTTKHTGSDLPSKVPSVPKLSVPTSSTKETTSVSTLPLEQQPTSKHSEPSTIAERKENATFEQTKLANTTRDTPTSKPEVAKTVATTLRGMETTKVVRKSPTTFGEFFNATKATVGNTYILPRGRKEEKEMSTPGQRVQDDPTPHDTSSRGPETQPTAGTSTIKASEADVGVADSPSKGSGGVTVMPTVNARDSDPEGTESPSKVQRGVTVAIVLSVLLLLVLLLAILFCWRRRRHSGSTSFKTGGWAGQAVLIDDTGLDKELEQGALTAGEGETRRATLTTFFGKRQSRVSSVAMEEVVQKETGDTEEAQPLTDGDASQGSGLEGSGEANGKLPKPTTVQCSQETDFPPPPATQEQPSPTRLE